MSAGSQENVYPDTTIAKIEIMSSSVPASVSGRTCRSRSKETLFLTVAISESWIHSAPIYAQIHPPPVLIALYGYENRIDLSAICINPLDSSTVVGVNLPVQVTLVIDGLRKETQLESLWLFFFFFFYRWTFVGIYFTRTGRLFL